MLNLEPPPEDFPKRLLDDKRPKSMFAFIQFIFLLVPLLFSVGLKTTQHWMKIEAEKKEAVNARLESELKHLSFQLQPHFFFNSLNNIYSLVHESPDEAQNAIYSLSKLMRYMLYDTKEETIGLHKEIEFLKRYIELSKLRVPENVMVSFAPPQVSREVQIAPMLFVSLIENAFKHGITANKKCYLNFEMSFSNNTVYFKSENTNYPKSDQDRSGSGIGIENLIHRLNLIYPKQHSYKSSIKDNIYKVELEITL